MDFPIFKVIVIVKVIVMYLFTSLSKAVRYFENTLQPLTERIFLS